MNMNITDRMYAYDFLKIIATIFIMCHHYQQAFVVHFPSFIDFYGGRIYWGYLVELFFLLSGWGIARKLEVSPIGSSIKDHLIFLVGRYRRLIPMVLLASVCEFIITRSYYDMYGEYVSWQTIYTYYDIFLNVVGLAVGTFYHYFYLCIDSPLWYVNVLLMCYCILCAELYVSRRMGWDKRFFFAATFIVGALYATIINRLSPPYVPFFNMYISRGYMGFFGGLLLYDFMKKHTINAKYFRFMPAMFVLGLLFIGSGTRMFTRVSYLFLDVVFWPTVIIYFSQRHINEHFNRWYVSLLVKASFAMYALHAPFMDAVKFGERYFGVSIEKSCLMTMYIYVCCMILVGLMAWYLVEGRRSKRR